MTWVPRYQNPSFFPALPENRRIALSMIKAMDDGVGRILDKLDTLGIDGENLIPHLEGSDPTPPHDCLYWRFWDQSAVRQGHWKYLAPSVSSPPMLFDLSTIRGEEDNLIGAHSDIAAALAARLDTWKAGLLRPGDLGSQLNNQEAPWYERHFGLGLGTEFNTPGDDEGWTPTGITNARVEFGKWKGEAGAGALLTQDDFFVRGASVGNLLVDLLATEDGTLTLQWARRGADTFDPGTWYVSFLIAANRTTGAFQANLRLQLGGTALARIGMQSGLIGLFPSTGTISGSTRPNDGTPHLLVARIDFDPAGVDLISLYLDPLPGDPEPATPLTSLSGEFSFDGFRLFNNPGSTTETILSIGKLRLASNWNAAVPRTD